MLNTLYILCLFAVGLPLGGALTAGFVGKKLGPIKTHQVVVTAVGLSCLISLIILWRVIHSHLPMQEFILYTWMAGENINLQIGFLIDPLTVLMMTVVTFVSLMVHIYTIGYMRDDPGYERFFCYISLFTFSMLMLVMSNNFLQLFFGWEAVGVMSYLLIGFWFKRDSATFANLKAFLVNRVGDFGFLLGIALIFMLFGTLNYSEIFNKLDFMDPHKTITIIGQWSVPMITLACLLLFVGAMGKSAQMPLHVWLPDSMEGPTPISALIHAATMVTAGVFMVARLSPLFELSEVARSFILIIGALTALFMGIVGLVQNDIKRVIAYSTLSQLGYMMVAAGVSAYAVGIFHLTTHAFFKALLFLGAGAVIMALHHEQDMRKMGGLRQYLPITFITMLLGSLALCGIPPFSGFYSKDIIIEAAHAAQLPGATFAYYAVLCSVFVTALYSFRLIFMVFYGTSKVESHTRAHLHEPGLVVWLPLVLLAIPSVIIGAILTEPLLFATETFFRQSIVVDPANNVLPHLSEHYTGPLSYAFHALQTWPFWFAIAGIVVATLCYRIFPQLPHWAATRFTLLYTVLVNKYGFDAFNQLVFVRGTRALAQGLWKGIDQTIIDGGLVMGTTKLVAWSGRMLRHLQTGYLNQYALIMIVGLLILLSVWVVELK